MDMEEEKFLKAVPILRDLDEGELHQFLRIAHRVRFPRGKTILTEGDTAETMYVIEEGMVEVSKSLVMARGPENSRDRDKILTKLSAGDHATFGELALFEQGRRRTATVVALTDCLFLEISKADFLRLAEENPRIGYKISRNIAELLCSRLRKANEDTIKLTTALSIALSR